MPPHLAETYETNRAKLVAADDALARCELGLLPLIPLVALIAGGLAGAYGVYRVGSAVLNKVDVAVDAIGQSAIDLSRVLVWVVGGAAAALVIGGTRKRLAA